MPSGWNLFFQGSSGFNIANLALTAGGFLLTAIGLAVGLHQIARVRRAAEAAKDSAERTAHRLGLVNAIMDIQRLSTHSGEALVLLRQGDAKGAAIRVSDVRAGLAHAREFHKDAKLLKPRQWQETITLVVGVLDQLHDSAASREQPALKSCIADMAAVHDTLSSLAAIASKASGAA